MGQLEKLPDGNYRFHTYISLDVGRNYNSIDDNKKKAQGEGVVRSRSWRIGPDGHEIIMTDGHGRRMYGN